MLLPRRVVLTKKRKFRLIVEMCTSSLLVEMCRYVKSLSVSLMYHYTFWLACILHTVGCLRYDLYKLFMIQVKYLSTTFMMY